MKSRVNRVEFYVNQKLLKGLFHLKDKGKKCVGAEYIDLSTNVLGVINHDDLVENLLEKFKSHADLEIRTKVLDPNVLRIHKRMFWALTKSIMLKVHSQSTFTRAKTKVFWHLFFNNRSFNFSWLVMENMIQTHKTLSIKKIC